MGFSGGGSNITKSHTHSSAIAQDGGALNFSNVTQAGMAAGDITYSNGTALQILNLGSATDILTVNGGATAPEWVTPVAAGSLWSVLGNYVAAGAEDSHNFNFTAVDFDDYSKLILTIDGNATDTLSVNIRINTSSAAQYYTDGDRISAGTETIIDINTATEGTLMDSALSAGGGQGFCVIADILLPAHVSDNFPQTYSRSSTNTATQVSRVNFNVDTSSITDIEIRSSADWDTGTRITLYKLARA